MRLPFVLALLVACSSSKDDVARVSLDGWDRDIAARVAVDRSPDPDIVEVDLEARIADVEIRPGTTTKAWTYDGGVPGPTIRAKVGDELRVHFKNSLPEPTTIHWHGVRVPAAMDGNGELTIPAGGTFEYVFRLPDAGTFWYHPHTSSAKQLGYGLYGALIVEDPSEPRFGDEATIVLSDMGVDERGALVDSKVGGAIADLFGREGEIVLANGKLRPTIRGRAGAPQRWRLINAARSRYYRITLDGHRFVRIGGDGGLRETPVTSDELMLVPGERADVVVVPTGAPSSRHALSWLPFERGFGTAFAREPEIVLELEIVDLPPVTAPPVPNAGRTIPRIDPTNANAKRIELTQSTVDGNTSLGVDGKPFDTMLHAKVGDTDAWEVVNTTDAHHPFHLHGFFFQVAPSSDGAAAWSGEWKDTIDIPMKSSRRLLVRYDDRPGSWMFHCHILDHAELGMMGMLMLDRP